MRCMVNEEVGIFCEVLLFRNFLSLMNRFKFTTETSMEFVNKREFISYTIEAVNAFKVVKV